MLSWLLGLVGRKPIKIKGVQRRAILRVMNIPKIATKVCKEVKEFHPRINLTSASAVLRDFVRKGIAVCLNPESEKFRLFKLTRKGRRLRVRLQKEG